METKEVYLNTCVFVDYENLFEKLEEYGTNPMQLNFFPLIKERLKEHFQLNIIDFIVYCNFEKNKLFNANHQTTLQALGVQTRHTSNTGKNSADLELTVDSLRTLYKNKNIDVFVIISNDRDNIPLIKAIKAENKVAFVISTENGFNKIVCAYADLHEYIEDIFNLDRSVLEQKQTDEYHVDPQSITSEMENRAKEVCKLFYSSNPYRKFIDNNMYVGLTGYANLLMGKVSRLKDEIIFDFKVANSLGYIILYKEESKQEIAIKDGENKDKIYE
ncbi:NYN domain-containing protein [Alkaliphilus hydrothermalis]|nr:NYN domain-containing protein [Alkaliphilus hydrothermalis]